MYCIVCDSYKASYWTIPYNLNQKKKFEEEGDSQWDFKILLVLLVCSCLKQFSIVGHSAGTWNRRHETRDVREETWDRRRETWDRRRETGDVRQEMWDWRCETGDVRLETWYMRVERPDRRQRRWETGDVRQEMWEKRKINFVKSDRWDLFEKYSSLTQFYDGANVFPKMRRSGTQIKFCGGANVIVQNCSWNNGAVVQKLKKVVHVTVVAQTKKSQWVTTC